MKKVLIVISVLAFAVGANTATAEDWAGVVKSINSFYARSHNDMTKADFIEHWQGSGFDCDSSGGTVICTNAKQGFIVFGGFSPRLHMTGVGLNALVGNCPNLYQGAVSALGKPTKTPEGLFIWKYGTTQSGFARPGLLFDGICVYTVRDLTVD